MFAKQGKPWYTIKNSTMNRRPSMKVAKTLLKIAAALGAVAVALFLVAIYLDKLLDLCERRTELKDKVRTGLKEKTNGLKQKLPTKEDLIRLNPFRKAEIEAEFADYADVD